jgi:hypothetical protein
MVSPTSEMLLASEVGLWFSKKNLLDIKLTFGTTAAG